ncbi:MAG: asparagine synthetase B family protein, partial [Gemmatimonadota bacterium]
VEGSAGGPALAFDGALTNRRVLLDELGRGGPPAGADGDRELVLRVWERSGAACLDRLMGRFALVLHDPRRGNTYLVRDRFGHKPLHYAIRHDRLYFASEIKTLLSVLSPPLLDDRALIEWSLHGDLLPPRTLFRGIRSLPPGHLLEADMNGERPASRAYYEPASAVDPALYAEHAGRSTAEILTLVEEAVEHAVLGHMDGRSGVGIMLSGGVDSTVIAAIAARRGEIPAYNFSVAGDPRLDERPMSREVARVLGLPLESIVIDGETYRRELARATYLYEHPLWHMQGVPIQLLARRAREDGTTLLLSGVSVGPLLGAATDRYRWILPPPALDRIPGGVYRVVRKAVYSAAGLPVANPGFTRALGVGLQLVDGGARSRIVARCDEAYRFLEDPRERRIHIMRLSDHHLFLPRFYHQGDRLCMGESIEYCDAAVEARFMSLALNLPTDVIFHDGTPKWILKELATRYVPREIAFQKKVPLDVPVAQYFAPAFKRSLFEGGFLASFLGLEWEVAGGPLMKARETTPLLFQLVNIEVWGRLFLMQQSVEEVTDLLSR